MIKRLKEWYNKRSSLVQNISAVFLGACSLLAIHALTKAVPQGWGTWAISLPAHLILIFTVAARVKDISATGPRWFARRIGLILVGMGALSLMTAPLVGYSLAFPSWRAVTLYWGFAVVWITTPNMPPWHKYISGEYKLKRNQQA